MLRSGQKITPKATTAMGVKDYYNVPILYSFFRLPSTVFDWGCGMIVPLQSGQYLNTDKIVTIEPNTSDHGSWVVVLEKDNWELYITDTDLATILAGNYHD